MLILNCTDPAGRGLSVTSKRARPFSTVSKTVPRLTAAPRLAPSSMTKVKVLGTSSRSSSRARYEMRFSPDSPGPYSTTRAPGTARSSGWKSPPKAGRTTTRAVVPGGGGFSRLTTISITLFALRAASALARSSVAVLSALPSAALSVTGLRSPISKTTEEGVANGESAGRSDIVSRSTPSSARSLSARTSIECSTPSTRVVGHAGSERMRSVGEPKPAVSPMRHSKSASSAAGPSAAPENDTT